MIPEGVSMTVTELMTTTIIQLIGCGTTLLPTSLETVVIPIDTGTIPPETSSSSVVDSIISSATSITTSLIGVAPGLATSAMQSASESSITSSTQSNPSSVSTPSHTSPLLETSPAPVQTPNANFATSIAALTATTFAGANEGPPINFSGVYLSSAINLGPLRESHRREKPQDGHEGDRAGNKPA
ncbi:hypothetical protein F4861DRAFT_187680 [Xylaria intraflava]|nr:hypothetical protein F4861DRAFT_187680 [Xylaria intraflava]